MPPRYRVVDNCDPQGGLCLTVFAMGNRMLRPAVLLIATLLLAGCVPSDPVITPAPEPSVAPIFASDEEALAAATEAYAKYLEVSNLIRSEGGIGPERIADFVTPERLPDELAGFTHFAEGGRHSVGSITFDSAKFQKYENEQAVGATVVMYLCLDASQVKFVDGEGKDVTPDDKPNRQLFEITMVSRSVDSSTLILSGSELWDNNSGC